MKNHPSTIFIMLILISLITSTVFAASYERPAPLNLETGQTATVNYSDWLEGTQSTLDISLSNIPVDAELSNGIYVGWCIQPGITGLLHSETATLYSSLNITLPSGLLGLPWNEINYVLNHKIRGAGKSDLEFHKDVQTAIWLLLGDPNPEFGVSTEAQQMVDNAIAHPQYLPGNGEIVAVIVYSDGMSRNRSDQVQETIIEVKFVLPPTNTPTAKPATQTGTPPTGTATSPAQTGTPPTGTATSPTQTGTPPTSTATSPTQTGTPPTGTATSPTQTGTPPTGTAVRLQQVQLRRRFQEESRYLALHGRRARCP